MEINEDRAVNQIGDHLKNKKIAILVCGGIAAYKTPGIIRQFRRYGADVTAYMTDNASDFVGKESIKWATGKNTNNLITVNSEQADHLNVYDIYVLVPATYNTINKFANGIADNVVTTTLATALGRSERSRSTVYVVPTMNGDMMTSIYRESITKLEQKGVIIVPPVMADNKANLPSEDFIVSYVIHKFYGENYKKKVLITGGPVGVEIDDVRRLVGNFSGATGVEIAKEAYLRGMNVTYVYSNISIRPPNYINSVCVNHYQEYYDTVMKLLEEGYNIGIFSAAVADYIPIAKLPGKTPSGLKDLTIKFKSTEKVIQIVQNNYPNLKMVTFKYQKNISVEELLEIANNRIASGYNMVVANRGEDINKTAHRSYIVQKDSSVICETKQETAKTIIEILNK